MPKRISITFESFDAWQNTQEEVNSILRELTGTDDYPSTMSIPPLIMVTDELDEDDIERVRYLDGVIVDVEEDEDN
ncbi:hypothetical protein NUU61_009271 [Penicillium alfredii]|uniref:Uncharacterized protein n=1 Tax=Penicillium alfredii TaxID=1506179 RepID=A0A9W9JXJ0_9EURO|nr:uncharacterized protein NUU61_009271 [Penicillium alfredii]KAJ5084692.1 hypothetical protein NUU61_009271 [Penicillium alfredii]